MLRRPQWKEDAPPVLMFDFDGVVADSLDIFHEEFAAACALLGFDRLGSRDSLLKLFETNAFVALVKAGFPIRRLKRLGREFAPRIQAANEKVQPFHGMPAILNELARRHTVYVITSNVTEAITAFLDRHEVTGIRDVIGADKERSKVKKIRRVVRQHRGARPFYIGDTKGDMLEAKAARVLAVAVGWGWHSVDLLKEGEPDFIVQSPPDLLDLFPER
ncbi:MAG: HAD hydrolase-like protein [Candidatus Hydrogenedentes bacterium]|nr:HAD hydrolase-like protein [Candidatus Hydrogenedentota bacterium]